MDRRSKGGVVHVAHLALGIRQRCRSSAVGARTAQQLQRRTELRRSGRRPRVALERRRLQFGPIPLDMQIRYSPIK